MNFKSIFLGLLLLTSMFGCVSFGNNADGIATDSIARVSYGGWIWKTWRVELTNDHPVSDGDGGMIAQRYGIENNDPTIIKQLQDYSSTGEKVRIYYHSHISVWAWEYSDAETIYKVESVKK